MNLRAKTPGRIVIVVRQHPGTPVPPPTLCILPASAPPTRAPLVVATRWTDEGCVYDASGSEFPTPGSYKVWLQAADRPPDPSRL